MCVHVSVCVLCARVHVCACPCLHVCVCVRVYVGGLRVHGYVCVWCVCTRVLCVHVHVYRYECVRHVRGSTCNDAEAGSGGGARKARIRTRGSDCHVGSVFGCRRRGRPVSVHGAQRVNTGAAWSRCLGLWRGWARCAWPLGVSDKPQDSQMCQPPFPHLEPPPLSRGP